MSPAEHTVVARLALSLSHMPCCCEHEYPYHDRGKLRRECHRCRSLREWTQLQANTGAPAARVPA